MVFRTFTIVQELFWYYCSPVCGSPTQWEWDLILSWLRPLLPSCCSFFFVVGHRLSFFVDYSSLLSMVVQQLVAILELFQEKMSVCPSTLPSWTRSPHCSFGLYLKTAASFSTKNKWKFRALIWSGGRGGSGVLEVLLISEVINSSSKNGRLKCEMMQLLWKTVWWFLTKLKVELLYYPAVPFLGLYLKELKIEYWRDICIFMFIASLFTVTKM